MLENTIFSLSDFLEPNIKEAIEMYNLNVIESDHHYVKLKGDLGITIEIIMESKTSFEVKIDYLSKRTTKDIPLDLLNDFIITDIQIP